MAIRQRGNTFLVDVTVHGKRYRVSASTREEAEHEQKKIMTQPEPVNGHSTWTLEEGYNRTLDMVWKGKGGEVSSVRNALAAIAFFGGRTKLDDITTDWIDGWIARLKQIGNSNGTINRKLAALSKIMSHAHHRGKLTKRPHFERQKESEGRIRYLTQEEEARALAILSQWGKDDHAEVFCVLVDTGLRPSELWRLEERDINFENKTMSIWDTKNENPRTVPMIQRVQEIIKRRIEVTLKGQRLFPYNNFWMDHVWERMKHSMGLVNDTQFVPYALRHTCASRLIQRKVALPVVKEWLGHKNITMTMRYAHLSATNLLEAAKVLEAC